MIDLTDAELIEKYRSTGDQSIFTALYERYGKRLEKYLAVHYLERDFILAEDIVQETFAKLHLKLKQFDPTKPLRPWLYSIAANAALDTGRKKQRRPVMSLHSICEIRRTDDQYEIWELRDQRDVNEYKDVEYDEAREMLKNSMAMLNDRDREAIEMIYFKEMSYRDVAAKLGITKSAVKSRVVRAIEAMRGGFPDDYFPKAA